MRNENKNSGISAIKLVLIITASIVAAAGAIFAIIHFIKKFKEKKALRELGCDCGCDYDDWCFDDEDIMGDLSFDEDENCGCDCDCDCDADVSAAVDEAIEAIEAVGKEEA